MSKNDVRNFNIECATDDEMIQEEIEICWLLNEMRNYQLDLEYLDRAQESAILEMAIIRSILRTLNNSQDLEIEEMKDLYGFEEQDVIDSAKTTLTLLKLAASTCLKERAEITTDLDELEEIIKGKLEKPHMRVKTNGILSITELGEDDRI